MSRTLVHRGPDDEGIYTRGRAGLGMRRLSIIDVDGGHQPIHNEDQSVWVVFNGEIYNYPELRASLERQGHRFYTRADTEVIVHLYEQFGNDYVTHLRGMFAIALYDERRAKLLLARDRLGEKPLFYAIHRGRLLFGSEIKALLAAAPDLSDLNPDAILQYFYFGYILDPISAFARVHKLPPGHVLEYDHTGRTTVGQYWNLPQFGTHQPACEEDCLDELEQRLSEAVRIRLASDVPLGALLSGGVDSSVVVALMARAGSGRVKTFSIAFRENRFDEAPFARAVAERFATDHHELVVEPNLDEALDLLTRMGEEPFADSSMLPTYYVCRMARKSVKVALSGDGGDELFAGYDRYGITVRRGRFNRIPDWAGRFYREHLHPRIPMSMLGRNLAWNAALNSRDRYLDDVSFLPALHRERGLFSAEFLNQASRVKEPLAQFRRFYDEAPATDHLSRVQYLDTKTYLPGDILTKVDRMSMACSLEVRPPLLDHELVAWAATLPPEWKLRFGQKKYVLKKLAERLNVPTAALYRPKQGFQLPLVDWMKGALQQKFLAVLLDPCTLQRGYFRPDAIRALIDEHLRGRRDRSAVLWQMLVLELWHRNWQSSPSCKA
jgi:asparagine synthase (glutamine-hydrolysing)